MTISFSAWNTERTRQQRVKGITIMRAAKCTIQYYQLYACPTVTSLGVFHDARQNWCHKLLIIHCIQNQIQKYFQCFCMKGLTHFPPQLSIHCICWGSLMESPHTPSPISPHNASLPVCPLVMAVPRYNSSPLIWHTVMQILGSTRISVTGVSLALPFPLIMQR